MENKSRKIAARYAKAICDYLQQPAVIHEVSGQLEAFSEMIKSNADLKFAMTAKNIAVESRMALLRDLSEALKLSSNSEKALRILIESGRIAECQTVSELMNEFYLASLGMAQIDVYSAKVLSSEQQKKVETKFENVLSKKIQARYHQDPSLIGGVRVVAAGRVYDGTVDNYLKTLQNKFTEGWM